MLGVWLARAVRPARGNPWGRSGRLHAPEAARTGPVNALRRYWGLLYGEPRGGLVSTDITDIFGPTDPALGWYTQGGHSGPLGISSGFFVVVGYHWWA